MVINKLRQAGQGFWTQDGSTDKLKFDAKTGCGDLELWRTKWCDATLPQMIPRNKT